MAGKPAARIGDPTCHGGTLVGPGVPTVFIGGMPASTMGDNHLCPMCTPATPPIPHVGGPVVLGSTGVFIGKKPAARLGDQSICVGPPSAIVMGCPTVLIGEAGNGSGSGAGAASPAEVSSLADAAAPLAALSSDRTSGTGHRIELRFEDSSGRPLAGVPFLLEDPKGQKVLAASDAEGGWLRTGLPQAGSYTVDVRLLRKARCDASKVELDKSCHFACEASGFPDGEPAVVKMQLLAADGTAQTIDTVRTQVKDERIEVSWSLTRQAYAQAMHSTEDFLPESVDAVFTAGVQSLLGTPVSLEVPKDAASLEIPTATLGAVHFRTDGCVPLLDDKLKLITTLADVLDYADEARERGETAILFGNASSSGSAAHNRELSLWRGLMVKALLEHDEIAWRNQARAHATPEDAQQIFTSLHANGWECDPASDSKGVLEFQKEANFRQELDLAEDGILGPRTWTAIHRALCSLIQEERGEDSQEAPDWTAPTWGYAAGAGVYPNGSDFTSGGNKEDLEICFFPKGCEPKLKLPKGGKPATKKENPAEGKGKSKKIPIYVPTVFTSAKEALFSALKRAYILTRRSATFPSHRIEFGGWIITIAEKQFSYTIPKNGTTEGVSPLPKPKNAVIAYHSHPDNNIGLSSGDYEFAKKWNIDIAVVNPNGTAAIGYIIKNPDRMQASTSVSAPIENLGQIIQRKHQ